MTLAGLIATVFGLGKAPLAPGTVASFAAAAVWWVLPLPASVQWVSTLLLVFIGIWAAGCEAARVREKDPSTVVVDEWVGMWLSLAGLPKQLWLVVLGLVFFRFFDIIKPSPLRQLEKLPGGWGILLDDVVAGLLVRIILGLLVFWFVR